MLVPPEFSRWAMLTGTAGFAALQKTSVALFGVGGVGSWAAESLVRSGIGSLTLVDSDCVCVTNINRQLQATSSTLGKPKVEVLAQRLQEINPLVQIQTIQDRYCAEKRHEFHLDQYDYVVDAIDSVSAKVDLICSASQAGSTVFSSMGAGNKWDPTAIRMAPIHKTRVCPLARTVRQKLRQMGFQQSIDCVYSEEPSRGKHSIAIQYDNHCQKCAANTPSRCPESLSFEQNDQEHGPQANASAVHITAIFGNYLASMVVHAVLEKEFSKGLL